MEKQLLEEILKEIKDLKKTNDERFDKLSKEIAEEFRSFAEFFDKKQCRKANA